MSRPIRSSDAGRTGRLAAILLFAALAAVFSLASPAHAERLNELRAAGVVGERFDGFAMVRDSGASAEVRSFVDRINAERRAHYESVARQENAPASEVGKVYANQIFRAAPRGYWFLTQAGSWRQK